MSLQSIRESYSKLLTAFDDAGVKLNESQKSDIDSFILALESTMSDQRQTTIKKTKAAVESKLEKQYRAMFESIMSNMQKNNALASKIQSLAIRIEESKKIAEKVSDYLDEHVAEVLPEKVVVDYARLHKLEQIHESLKQSLAFSDDTVEEAKKNLEKTFKKNKGKLETEIAKMQVKFNESQETIKKLKTKLGHYKAADILESKTKDLPSYEARQVKKRLAEATAEEIEKKFDKTLESVKTDAEKIAQIQETSIDDEIKNIMEQDDVQDQKAPMQQTPAQQKPEDDFETIEQVNVDDDGDVVLDESDVIDPAIMKMYCALSQESR